MAATANRVALITGANKGLGLEIARQLGREGVTVVIGARDSAKGDSAAAQLREEKIDAHALKLDVTNAQDIAAAPAYFENTFGRLDILVNNAGVMIETDDWTAATASSISPETLRQTFDANFFGVVALTQTLLPLLRKSPEGRIVNHSSILGSLTLHADPASPIYTTKTFAYNVSKAALNGFTIHLAYELKDTPIKVNSAHPGWVKTDMGTDAAPMNVTDGAKTAVRLALLPADGPTGGYFHFNDSLPW